MNKEDTLTVLTSTFQKPARLSEVPRSQELTGRYHTTGQDI